MTARKVKPVLVTDLVLMLGGTVRKPGPEFKPNVRYVELPTGWHDAVTTGERAYEGGRCTFGGTVDMTLNALDHAGLAATLNHTPKWGWEFFVEGTESGLGQTPSQAIWSWVRRNRRCK